MSAKTRLAHIKALGFTIDQEMIDRENRIDEAAQVRICNEMVAEVAPMIMTLRSAVAGTYIVDDEQAADAEWLNSDGRNEIEHAQITATFGKVKVTTSAEWRKRHLHQTAEQVEAAKVQAEMLKGLQS